PGHLHRQVSMRPDVLQIALDVRPVQHVVVRKIDASPLIVVVARGDDLTRWRDVAKVKPPVGVDQSSRALRGCANACGRTGLRRRAGRQPDQNEANRQQDPAAKRAELLKAHGAEPKSLNSHFPSSAADARLRGCGFLLWPRLAWHSRPGHADGPPQSSAASTGETPVPRGPQKKATPDSAT